MKLFTIGFTKKSAERFFSLLRNAGVKRVIDTRLNRKSQLAGFAKETDLPFLLREICHADYLQEPLTAPTDDILKAYKGKQIDWAEYERRFKDLIATRHIEERLERDRFDGACVLCSEDKPHHCHRRLVAEYLKDKWGDIQIVHL
ncbi:MAG: DUF488 domain-containing protein [Steroidobacteraceae bacterium]